MKQFSTALVIGAGSFGTSIASILANNFEKVILLVRSQEIYNQLLNGENSTYLSGKPLDPNLTPALSWDEVKEKSGGDLELIVSGLPTVGITDFCESHFDSLKMYLDKKTPVVSLSKGIDPQTLELPDDLFFNYYSHYRDLFTFLSGPSFAQEIMEKQITLVSLAGRSRITLEKVAQMMEAPYFKALSNYDVKGVLLGGALKNVLAICGGIIEGHGFNHNTRAAMITRGIAEMLRFGKVFNARPETFYGLSGMGDLILTTTGGPSRNRSFGLEIAKGKCPEEIIKGQRTVVEGYKTTKAAHLVAERYQIRARIFNGLYSVLYEGVRPLQVIQNLMKIPSKFEVD